MEDKETSETVEEDEDPEFICNRCRRPFDPVKWRSIAKVGDKKFLCPRCFKLLLS